jgi:cellulose synthase/poly-beta-1,6-N-acetylglucosamine synthase-like glycosyltransferase
MRFAFVGALGVFLLTIALSGFINANAPHTNGQEFSLWVYLLANVIVFVDLYDYLLRIRHWRIQSRRPRRSTRSPTSTPIVVGRFNPYQRRLHLRPYVITVSVHDLGDSLDEFVAAMAPHRGRLFVIDDASNDGTAARLEAAGLQVIRGTRNRHKPGAIRELLRYLPADVETILIMDPDSRVLELAGGDISTLESVIFEFQRSGHAALCPRITAARRNWLTRLQRLEFALSFGVGRKGLGDFSVTSGVAVYRRASLERLLAEHSLSVYAEDLENTLHLVARDERIYYDERLVVETEGKADVASWFSQRVGWAFGLAKVYSLNERMVWRASARDPMHFYQYLIYLGVFGLVFHPLKLLSLVPLFGSALNDLDLLLGTGLVPRNALTHSWYFPLVFAKYTLLIAAVIPFAVPRGERSEHLPVVPFYFIYGLAQLVPTTVGFFNWISFRVAGRRLYRDHFADDGQIHG